MSSEERLEKLRRRIRNLDAALLGLVAERTELAREVGAAKRELGVPLRDYEVEKRVLERASETATSLGLDVELARAVLGQLIEEACRVQELDRVAVAAGAAESVLVVGGAGRMGGWLRRFLESQGHRVRIHDPAARADDAAAVGSLERGLEGSTLAFVATPLAATGRSILEIAESGWGGVTCDVAGLKEHLRPALERARSLGARVTSIHPMFGPGARTLADRVVVVCDCGDAGATARVTALFRETAARLVPLSLERHDRIAGYVLGLSHLVSLLFARTLERSGLALEEIAGVGSTTFRAQMATAERVIEESPELYFDIQRLNRATPRVLTELERSLGDWRGWIAAEDGAEFARAMLSARAWRRGEGAAG
ncbi:MAG TPA: bifunctional chorismate mutase/prephenate dehydrogenase [Thermoanaerobaculia bacterium]|nr:bifunctional chorismate mutase/prephenate dehydrogenase [Thermoanaerobaculia bacterium]